jgi:uncharacterized protein YndB with AHSA1/START domain
MLGVLLASSLATALAQERVDVSKHRANHRSIHTEIRIDATPTQVWEVMTDFETYPEWSKVFVGLEGDFRDQGVVTVSFQLKKKLQTYEHVLNVVDGTSFSWSDPFAAGMRDHHVYRLEALPDGRTLFVQEDEAKGGATWLFGRTVTRFQEENYPLYNRALKAEVERRFAQ